MDPEPIASPLPRAKPDSIKELLLSRAEVAYGVREGTVASKQGRRMLEYVTLNRNAWERTLMRPSHKRGKVAGEAARYGLAI